VFVLNLVLVALLQTLQMVGTILSVGHYMPATALRDLLLKLPFAMVLCFALWLAIVVGRTRPLVVGLVGFFVAPLASLAAHSIAIGAESYAVAAKVTHTLPPLFAAGVRGVEYASFGALIAWLHTRRWAHARHHACVGFCIGLIFGGSVLVMTAATQALTPVLLIGWLVNQLLFPVGCALVLFHVTREGRTRSDTHSAEHRERVRGGREAQG